MNNLIKKQIKAGPNTNANEEMGGLNKSGQEDNANTDAIRTALIEGENSGEPKAFDFLAFKQRMQTKHLQQSENQNK